MGKWRHREVKPLAQGHTATAQQSWEFNMSSLTPTTEFLPSLPICSFIHSMNIDDHYVPSPVLDTGDPAENRRAIFPSLLDQLEAGGRQNMQLNKMIISNSDT